MKKIIFIFLILIICILILLTLLTFNYRTIRDKTNNTKESELKYKFELFNPEITFSTQIMDRLDE